ARRFESVLKEAGVPVTRVAASDTTHSRLNDDLGKEGDPATEALLTFLDEAVNHGADRSGSARSEGGGVSCVRGPQDPTACCARMEVGEPKGNDNDRRTASRSSGVAGRRIGTPLRAALRAAS